MVTDLHHLLDLPVDCPAPARKLAERLGDIVRAATAGDVGGVWETALPCARRPGRRACPGRMLVQRTAPEEPIRWQCSACGDDGVISGWDGSPHDLRRRGLQVSQPTIEVAISLHVAATIRDLQLLLDRDVERLICRARARGDRAVLAVADGDADELIGAVAAEANHDPDRRRQRRLHTAVQALQDVAGGR